MNIHDLTGPAKLHMYVNSPVCQEKYFCYIISYSRWIVFWPVLLEHDFIDRWRVDKSLCVHIFFTAIAFVTKDKFEKDIYEINQIVINCCRRT
jgi:hypothetical protein